VSILRLIAGAAGLPLSSEQVVALSNAPWFYNGAFLCETVTIDACRADNACEAVQIESPSDTERHSICVNDNVSLRYIAILQDIDQIVHCFDPSNCGFITFDDFKRGISEICASEWSPSEYTLYSGTFAVELAEAICAE